MSTPDQNWWVEQTGEYVLGTLNDEGRAVIDAVVPHDSTVRKMLTDWEVFFDKITDELPNFEPPSDNFPIILDKIRSSSLQLSTDNNDLYAEPNSKVARLQAEAVANGTKKAETLGQRLAQWQSYAAIVTAASLLIGMITLTLIESKKPNIEFDRITILTNEAAEPLIIVATTNNGEKLRVTVLSDLNIQTDQSLQLWMAKPNNGGVSSIGLIPTQNNQVKIYETDIDLQSAAGFAVSLEASNGTTETAPTGPVLYQGAIRQLVLDAN